MKDPTSSETHRLSRNNRAALANSQKCGCFYCLKIFDPREIKEWCDKRERQGTAICPHCHIDSIIGDAQAELSDEFLRQMQAHWFGRSTHVSDLV